MTTLAHRPDQVGTDAHTSDVGPVQTPPATTARATPIPDPSLAGTLPADQQTHDAHLLFVGGDQLPAETNEAPPPKWLSSLSGPDGQPATTDSTTPKPEPSLADPFLALAADVLDDTERTLIANQNRLRQLTRTGVDTDGIERGFGLDESHPDVARLASLVDMLGQVEHQATLNLQRHMRAHPLGPWAKAQRGLGEKRMARLLATIGDPYWNTAKDEPRTVSQLWAYCGLHTLPVDHEPPGTQRSDVGGGHIQPGSDHDDLDAQSAHVAARRRKGQRANWSTAAKTRAWLNIESCMKQLDPGCKTDTGIADHQADCRCSPYRIAVDRRRLHTAQTHPEWTPGHSLNDAMRVASKALLRDLWREARRIHEENA